MIIFYMGMGSYLPSIEEIDRIGRLRESAAEILDDRYVDCDRQGHRKPRRRKNMCGYCFRRLEYRTPNTDAILESRKDLPLMDSPVDAPYIEDLQKQEIASQRMTDRFSGLQVVIEQLKAKENRGPLRKLLGF